MKQIKVMVTSMVHVSTTGTNLTAAHDLLSDTRRNRLKVIEGALSVERTLESVIVYYFFGDAHERRAVFESMILGSDWCSFAAKRKLIDHIIDDRNLLQGNEKNIFENVMRKVISYRN